MSDELVQQGGQGGEAGGESATPAATTPTEVAAVVVAPVAGALSPSQFDALKAALIEANPHVVAELIVGDTVDAVLASATAAKAAYQRVATSVAEAATGGVLAGGGSREPDRAVYDSLSPEGKIQMALERKG